VLMSATIFSPEYWASRMGVSESDVEYIDIPSTFPLDTRPIYYVPVMQMNNKAWDTPEEITTKMVGAIDQIIAQMLPHKGLIHGVSKRLSYFIRDNSQFKDLMIVGGQEQLDSFKAADSAVLVSYDAIEGVDLPDDLCRFVIMPKVPWLPTNDPVIQVQREEIPGFYNYEAISAIVQGLGRGQRHKDDWSVGYILDSSFGGLYAQTKDMLPSSFKDAVIRRERLY
jgi:ATP-dependent DNA helicase DinG